MTPDQLRAANIAMQCRAVSAIAKSVARDLKEFSPGSHGFIDWLVVASENATTIAKSMDVRAGKAPEAERLADHKMHRRSFDIRSKMEDDFYNGA